MDRKPKTERLSAARPEDIVRAAEILRDGGLVAFPTETVYGLGANALSAAAVEKIFVAKQRPHWDPLIVHVCDRAMLDRVALAWGLQLGSSPAALTRKTFAPEDVSAPERNRILQALIVRFWPGPLTLLLPRTSTIPDAVTAGRPLVGVRMPAHPIALDLIRLAGLPIAAPSANTFGHTSPTTAAHVLADLDGRIDAVLDGGPTLIGVESTVAEITNQGVRIYRPGAIDSGLLETVVDFAETYVADQQSPSKPQSLPAPGVGLRHYAPRAKLLLVATTGKERLRADLAEQESLVESIDRAFDGAEMLGVLLPDGWNSSCAQLIFRWGPWHDPETLAHRLFAGLRELDDRGATTILCPVPEVSGIGDAIRDRLQKAARAF